MKVGLFVGRMNPPHIGHTNIIRQAMKENDRVIVLLWNSWVVDENNPFTFDQRKFLLQKLFWDKIEIYDLLDVSTDLQWVGNIKKFLPQKMTQLIIYGGDFKNDSAILAIKKYQYLFELREVSYKEIYRYNSYITYNNTKIPLSATEFRKVLQAWNIELIKNFCEWEIYEDIKNIYTGKKR